MLFSFFLQSKILVRLKMSSSTFDTRAQQSLFQPRSCNYCWIQICGFGWKWMQLLVATAESGCGCERLRQGVTKSNWVVLQAAKLFRIREFVVAATAAIYLLLGRVLLHLQLIKSLVAKCGYESGSLINTNTYTYSGLSI